MTNLQKIKKAIKKVNDFPKKGVVFRDVIPLLEDPKLLNIVTNELIKATKHLKYDVIISSESRGFWFSIPLALATGKKWVPCRKAGKLPGKIMSVSYGLEYGKATLEVQKGAIKPNDRVLIIDDLIATGGTIKAMVDLVKKSKAKTVGCCFAVNLKYLPGEKLVKEELKLPLISLIEYDK